MNESHDNNESLVGIADGGLASFVKSSTMNDDYCKCDVSSSGSPNVLHLDQPNKDSKIKREHSTSDKKVSSSKPPLSARRPILVPLSCRKIEI
jgi:hypothetical protein